MAIQLNERDHLIFKYIEEHEVLLEKHISWFISCDDKPVLIRDRLRKLFYLDYLLCQRHKSTLPWWTTPTKPLVYMLSPMTRELVAANGDNIDYDDNDLQRHLLEIANLRMLFLVAQNEGHLSDFDWTTIRSRDNKRFLDAKVSFVSNGMEYKVGIVNQPQADATLLSGMKAALCENGVETVWIISRDEAHQQAVQKCIVASNDSTIIKGSAFATHHELYKSNMIKTKWQNADQRQMALFAEPIVAVTVPQPVSA